MRKALISLALCLSAPALAAPADSYYAQGQFAMAASAAKAAGDYLMAARATLIQAAFQASTKTEALSMLNSALAEINAAPGSTDATLQRALIGWFLDVHAREHGMTEVWPPVLVNADSARGTGQIPDKEDQMYVVQCLGEGLGQDAPALRGPASLSRQALQSTANGT